MIGHEAYALIVLPRDSEEYPFVLPAPYDPQHPIGSLEIARTLALENAASDSARGVMILRQITDASAYRHMHTKTLYAILQITDADEKYDLFISSPITHPKDLIGEKSHPNHQSPVILFEHIETVTGK